MAPIYDHDIIIISDEAHRSQCSIFADNMVRLLPATNIGLRYTAAVNDNITERTFGGYISVYDFKRAVDDGATLPLYYENRGEKILMSRLAESPTSFGCRAGDLDVDQQDKGSGVRQGVHLLTAAPSGVHRPRFCCHYSDLWTNGKAMFVCLNKVTCVRMYDLMQKYWAKLMMH